MENYGVFGSLAKSLASTPVNTSTRLIFIGQSAKGDLNKPVLIQSFADYETVLGGKPGDGYNLTDAAVAAFQIAGIHPVWMIPVSNSKEFLASDYTGSAQNETGVYAVQSLLRENPSAVTILCAPGVTDATVITALVANAKKADGHWDSYVYYDMDVDSCVDVAEGVAIKLKEKITKLSTDEFSHCCCGDAALLGGGYVSGAAVRASLQALADFNNHNIPARSGGNLAVPQIAGWGDATHGILKLPEAIATQLSGKGISTIINIGGGNFRTWGDHTAAYDDKVSDERARFDCTIRMLQLITNRFQMKYRNAIDERMTLQMRNDIINEELDYMQGLVGTGDLIGDPECRFVEADNPADALQRGEFVWSIQCTPTIPLKYARINVAYTSTGISVYA